MSDRERAKQQNKQNIHPDRTQSQNKQDELLVDRTQLELQKYKTALDRSRQQLEQEKQERKQLLAELSVTQAKLETLAAKLEQSSSETKKQKAFESEQYYALPQQTSSALSHENLFRGMLKHIHNLIPGDVTSGVLIQDKHCEIFLAPNRFLSNSAQVAIQQMLLDSVVKINNLDIINLPLCLHNFNYQQPQLSYPAIAKVNSHLLVPIFVSAKEKRIIGFLFVGAEKQAQFTENHTRILNAIAYQASISIQQNQKLLEAEQSQLETEKIRQALAREKELNELKSRIVRTISHEYRTPLTVISLATDLLENQNKKLNQQQKKACFEQIHGAIQYMANLVEDAIVVNQAESAEIKFNPIQIDVVELCQQIINDFQSITNQKHQINLIDKNCDRLVNLDKQLLRQILSNLLSNAVKYSSQPETVILECICHHQDIQFRVSDRGIGIPSEEQHQLFERFYRGTNVGTLPGTGLGLAIVKKCVEIHGGEISIQSQVNIGTTVTVQLPLSKQI